jgi:tRNA(adenine34) deaminase
MHHADVHRNMNSPIETDRSFMLQALELAEQAAARDEVPVGAVIVVDGQVVATGHNEREQTNDPTAHAEIVALRAASRVLESWRMLNSRLRRVVYGAMDPKAGAMGSLYNLGSDPRLNHEVELTWGVEDERCSELLSNYFRRLRNGSNGVSE